MKVNWPKTKLGQVLTKSKETIKLIPNIEYYEITVRRWHAGVTERGRILGSEIASGRRSLVRGGQFTYSKLDAHHGCFGIIPSTLDGAIVSNEYPSFYIDHNRLNERFLWWMTHLPWFIEAFLASGEGSGRVRVRENKVMSLDIPLPPLTEQQRVVARIEELAAKIHDASALRSQAVDEAEALCSAELRRVFNFEDSAQTNVGNYARVQGGYAFPSSGYNEQGSYQIVRIGNVRDGYLDLSRAPVRWNPVGDNRVMRYQLQAGDIVISMTGTRDKRDYGFVARVPKGVPLLLNQRVGRFVLQREVEADYLFQFLRSPFFRDRLFPSATGTANQANVGNAHIERIPFTPPELSEQCRIVAELDVLQAEVDALKRLQAETTVELDALLPSILDRAFKGEL